MRIGISTSSFFNKVSTESTFDFLRQMNVDITELFLNTFIEYEKPFVDALIPRKGAINVHSVHAQSLQFEPLLFNSNARVRADAENLFRKICYAGFAMGAKYYTFHGPFNIKNEKKLKIDYDKLCYRINQLIDIAQGYGVRLSYENVSWTYASNPEFFKQVFSRCPLLTATLDVKQALKAGINPIKFLNAMEGRVATVHICDYGKNSTQLPGDGKYNFKKFFKELVNRGINAPIFIEAYSRDYNDLNELWDCYNNMKQLISEVKN